MHAPAVVVTVDALVIGAGLPLELLSLSQLPSLGQGILLHAEVAPQSCFLVVGSYAYTRQARLCEE